MIWNCKKMENETVITESECCDACPYVVYGKDGERRCYKDQKIQCDDGTMYGEAE